MSPVLATAERPSRIPAWRSTARAVSTPTRPTTTSATPAQPRRTSRFPSGSTMCPLASAVRTTTPTSSASPKTNAHLALVSSGCPPGFGGGLGVASALSPIAKLVRPRTSCRSSRSRTTNPMRCSPSGSWGSGTTRTRSSVGSTVPCSGAVSAGDRNVTSMNEDVIGSLNRTTNCGGDAATSVPSAGLMSRISAWARAVAGDNASTSATTSPSANVRATVTLRITDRSGSHCPAR